MKNKMLALLLVLLLAPVPSDAAKPIMNMIDIPVPIQTDGSRYPIEDVMAAIIQGCQRESWVPVVADEKTIRAKLNVKNKHFAEVDIEYSDSRYSITYASSTNFDYNEARQSIHRNYNRWVLRLSTAINKQFQTLNTSTVSADPGREGTGIDKEDIFDELLKLDELRDQGILTDEEFEVEKRKLLERN